MAELTPFELDVLGQPAALHAVADAGAVLGLHELASHVWDRVIFTGMGSSHFAGIASWRAFTGLGNPSWSVDAGQLLDTPGLITPNSLVIATSQSGASGEIVELIERLADGRIPRGHLVGIAANATSPLAASADLFLPLHSGSEATVSTKSYLNSLAVHRQLIGAFAGEAPDIAQADIRNTATSVTAVLDSTEVSGLAELALSFDDRRLAAVGWGDHAATALFAGLITKEAAKVPIEGYVGGQFRHGPFELAGPGLTVFIYSAHHSEDNPSVRRLAEDLTATGSSVIVVGDLHVDGATTLGRSQSSALEGLATGAVVAELIAIALANASGVVPGAFAFGSKVTTAL